MWRIVLALVLALCVEVNTVSARDSGERKQNASSQGAAEGSDNYAGKVRTMLDNLIEYGRDRYGQEHSPLFAAILDEDTLDCPEQSQRNRDTNLFDSSGGGSNGIFTTMQATVARDWITAGRQTRDPELVLRGRAILDGYAKHGYDQATGLFFAALNLDGTPAQPHAERGLVTGDQSRPVGYLAVWQPHSGWHELPLALGMQQLTGDASWLRLAQEVADEAVNELWRGKIFVGHPLKRHYMNTDHVGILLYALLQLDVARGGNRLKIEMVF